MIFNDEDGKDDEYFKRIKEQKDVEMENRRRAMINKCNIKQRLREHHIKRKEAAEVEEVQRNKEVTKQKVRQLGLMERLAKELSRRKRKNTCIRVMQKFLFHFIRIQNDCTKALRGRQKLLISIYCIYTDIEQQEALKCRKKKSAVPSVSSNKIHTELIKEQKRDEETQTSQSYNGWRFSEEGCETQQQEKKLNYRKELQNQLINNRRRLREKEEEKHRERKILEEAGETIRNENLETEKRKLETAALLQAEREAFFKAREFWKGKRTEVLRQEHDEISRIIIEKEAREKREAEGKTDVRATKEVMVEKLSKKLMEEERKKMEREEISRELYLAEKENELTREAMKLFVDKKRTARELLQDMARQQKAYAEKKAKENEIDAAFAKYLAEERRNLEERKSQEEQARRERGIQYGNELREAISKNRLQRLKDAAQENEKEAERKKTKNIFTWSNDDEQHKIKCHSESVLETWKSQQQNNATSA